MSEVKTIVRKKALTAIHWYSFGSKAPKVACGVKLNNVNWSYDSEKITCNNCTKSYKKVKGEQEVASRS